MFSYYYYFSYTNNFTKKHDIWIYTRISIYHVLTDTFHIYLYIFIYVHTWQIFTKILLFHVKCKNNKNINYMLYFLIHKVLFSTKFLIFEIFRELSFRNNYFSSLLDNKGSKSSSSNANRASRVAIFKGAGTQ